ncbi:hypothetical protein ACHMW6_15425 [Pseudoduganella sp. UC29_106]|uniref:hypothetical protein n=1 Tax=Pseudoduganella sp. UC29_106 TaxID=3374553 RepID=UPI0037568D78
MTTGAVIQISQVRAAKEATAAAKHGERFLLEMSTADAEFFSYFYQHGHEKSALRLLAISKGEWYWQPEWHKPGSRPNLWVTEGEAEFLSYLHRKGHVAAARQLMKAVNKPLPGEERRWGKVLPIPPKASACPSVSGGTS